MRRRKSIDRAAQIRDELDLLRRAHDDRHLTNEEYAAQSARLIYELKTARTKKRFAET